MKSKVTCSYTALLMIPEYALTFMFYDKCECCGQEKRLPPCLLITIKENDEPRDIIAKLRKAADSFEKAIKRHEEIE